MRRSDKVEEAVEGQLRIGEFIEAHKGRLFEKLEENFRRCQNQEQGALMFLAESLPLISGVVHVGTRLQDLRDTCDWVKECLPDGDPVSVLSTLTLIYIVRKGAEEFAEDADYHRRETWRNMCELLESRVPV